MKKFIAFYYAPASAMSKMANATDEEKMAGMAPWMAWKEKCGDHVVDFGAPVMPGSSLNADGKWSQSNKEVTGYSILQGESLEAVQALFEGHPHLSWAENCSIEVHEFAAM